jgi:2-octaprenyl-6-methoxyphenol hydroxylase
MNGISSNKRVYEAIVIGGGPVGLATTVALAQANVSVTLVAARRPYPDNRTTALLGGSVEFLQRLDVWRRCESQATALRTMRLVDNTGRLIRAPEVRFTSDEIGLDAFGYNIENRILLEALEARAAELDQIVRCDDEAETVEADASGVTVLTRQGVALRTQLAVGADGRQSICRDAAGIGVKRRRLQQAALTFNIGHARPHHNTSTEFHTPEGPCVFVPLSGNRSSVVWVASPTEAERLMALSDDDMSVAAERMMHSILGRVRVEPGRHIFPLAIEQPRQFASNRVVLVGEAAHVLPPIGAQGLNMGLRDAADVADIATEAMARGEDLGAPQVISRFDSKRRSDIASRTLAIDLANRSLLSDLLPMQAVRAAGLQLLSSVGPLRRLAMREGLAPSWRRATPIR